MVELQGVVLYSCGENGKKTIFGAYRICDSGYHAWPCLSFHSKTECPTVSKCVGQRILSQYDELSLIALIIMLGAKEILNGMQQDSLIDVN